MRVNDGAELVWNLKTAHQHRGRIGRDRENDGVVCAKPDCLSTEVEHFDAAVGKGERPELVLHVKRRPVLFEKRERRFDQRRAEAFAGDKRAARPAADGKGFAHDRGGEPRRALRRIDIQSGED